METVVIVIKKNLFKKSVGRLVTETADITIKDRCEKSILKSLIKKYFKEEVDEPEQHLLEIRRFGKYKSGNTTTYILS